jgi:hypothetical protein
LNHVQDAHAKPKLPDLNLRNLRMIFDANRYHRRRHWRFDVALALKQFGFEPQIFEQAPQLLEVGSR